MRTICTKVLLQWDRCHADKMENGQKKRDRICDLFDCCERRIVKKRSMKWGIGINQRVSFRDFFTPTHPLK
ncbi:MAG: hypothetical protein HKN16_07475 [Saprospiraceae bacterium]|nr:hypothetical protein [Saprospiraceae bacterium]